jgi:hypothetical protein
MARRKTKKTKRKTTRSKRRWQLPDLDWQRAGRIGTGVGWLVGIGAVAAGIALGTPRLEAYAADGRWTDEMAVEFEEAPAWVRGDLEAWLGLVVLAEMSGNPLRRTDLVAGREALMQTGCFETIRQVRRQSTNRIVVDAVFIVPHAIIRDEGGDHLVDNHGRLLPGSYRPAEGHTFVTIAGPAFGRPVEPGLEWPGSDVTAALDLLRMIERKPWRDQIHGIDVSRFLTDDTITLATDRDSVIIWGAAPGAEGAREVLAGQKLAYLDHNHRDYFHVDRGCNRLNVSGAVVTCLD